MLASVLGRSARVPVVPARAAAVAARRKLSSRAAGDNELTAKPLLLDPALETIISRFQSSLKAGRARAESKSANLLDDIGQLQRFRVQKVLLVCSDYDSYTFEEDGLLTESLWSEYSEHALLSKPPTIDRVASPELAVERFKELGDYDMVIALSRLAQQSNLIDEILRVAPATPIGLLALTPSELTSSNKLVDESMRLNVNKRILFDTYSSHGKVSAQGGGGAAANSAASRPVIGAPGTGADAWIWPFMWQGSPSVFTAMFKAVEDRINVKADSEYGVGTILIVEDSVKFYSSYLPLLYSELWRQNRTIQSETMHAREHILRMHSRPKVLFCTNFEEAMDVFDRYQHNIFGVITDLGFPKEGVHTANAGLRFAAHIKEIQPELPVLMQSQSLEDSAEADAARSLGLKFVCKQSPVLLQSLREFLVDDLMFGPLKFQDSDGTPLGGASTVASLLKTYENLPLSAVSYHARHSHLSRWFFARAEFQLARRFRASNYPADFIDGDGKERPDWLRNWILSEVRAHRNKLASTVENAQTADATTPIVRLGSGSLGGKGRGFRFLHTLSDKIAMGTVIPDMELIVPQCYILSTSVFDDFMERNALTAPALNATSDAEVVRLFDEATLPDEVTKSLERYLETSSGPVAVRSSSLFEDAFMQPFAGIYESMLMPNQGDTSSRLEQLQWAVKRVYASTFSQCAKDYAASMSNRTEEEKMAVILQPLVGTPDADGKFFYPTLAGVANSLDFYPLPHTAPTHGCAQVGLGLGAGVVDNNPATHFSLGDPTTLTGPKMAKLPVTALDLSAGPGSSELVVTLADAADSALLTVRKSSGIELAPEASRSVPLTQDVHGEKVVFKSSYGAVVDETGGAAGGEPAQLMSTTLPQLLAGEAPLAKALSFLLRLGQAGLGCPVELEFALEARRAPDARHRLHLLQIRPQANFPPNTGERFGFLPSSDYAAVASARALGHGRFDGIRDVVYVSPERFDKMSTSEIAREISAVNSRLQAEGRKYLLMAPGRWGSGDSTSGIPVTWSDIDSSAVIVETALDEHVPVSQGSHFFQNIVSFGLGYMSIDTSKTEASEVADYAFWESMPPTEESVAAKYVRHVRLDTPLEVVIDAQSRNGVVMKPGKPFDVYVSQVDAFMALSREQFGSNA